MPEVGDPQPGGFRKKGPDTSKKAALNPVNMKRWGIQKVRLLEAFKDFGEMIPEEAGRLTGIGDYNDKRRSSDLVKDGLLEVTGRKEKSSFNHDCSVLRITQLGIDALADYHSTLADYHSRKPPSVPAEY